MNTEISGVILQWTLLVTLCYPLGRYIAKVYRGERTWLDFMAPVERAIYRFCGIDPAVYSGFAFGLGIDRIAVTRYKISDMRLLFENDLRFLEQFK